MTLMKLLELWRREGVFARLLEESLHPGFRAGVYGLSGSARVFFQAALAFHCGYPALIVTPDAPGAEKVYEDLITFFPREHVHLLGQREMFLGADVYTRSAEQREQRLSFYKILQEGRQVITVAPIAALLSRVPPFRVWQASIIELAPESLFDREELLDKLTFLGYERMPLVEGKGQFSVRGEIIDIFPFGWEQPIRVELYNEEIESLRIYDHENQRSIEKIEKAAILPAHEYFLLPEKMKAGEVRLKKELEHLLSRQRKNEDKEQAVYFRRRLEEHIDHLRKPGGLEALGSYFPFFYDAGNSLLDYLPENYLLLIDEPVTTFEKGEQLQKALEEHRSTFFLQGEVLPAGLSSIWPVKEFFARASCTLLTFTLFPGEGREIHKGEELHVRTFNASHYYGQWDLLKEDYSKWRKDGYRLLFLCATQERGKGLQKTLSENNLPVEIRREPDHSAEGGSPAQMVVASLENGFIIPSLRLAVLGEHNLVPRRRKRKRLTSKEGIKLGNYRELTAGDYVVHEHHGIGKYFGMKTLQVSGTQRDYLLVKYSGTDKLYIPADQIHLIQKYAGAEGKAPRLHSLGGGEWQRVKSKVSASVHEVARELLSLYAARRFVQGYAYSGDHPWQLEFEARFLYEETTDQLQAIKEVKADMEKGRPMDRLICGDVGYGKTEVALRAAFKAAVEGKQVALLAPTTVLTQQHYRTFQERFADFPIRVAQLSRFVSPSSQKQILEDMARGKIDIIIGTHRLLSDDVRFLDLGLLIIDEEQRFGVRHKEKLKKMRTNVDVLSMTATPIPRTLHLSLAGARDLSIIESPPENRYPVQTFVVEYSEQLIYEAIERELERQGQVYFVFNRIDGINTMARRIKEIFSGVPIAVGHGQMGESKLEKIMNDFLDGKYKILVTTTIIEAGLDIPNVNTLIVFDADRFGLAQLYQLRGRVGRSNRVAYAYLTYRKDKIITETARKRLQSVKDFTELGSGFKIALKDLEIRGAGNILGAEQHGFMVAVGFDLYCRLLEQAVSEIREEKPEPKKPEPRLDLQVNAYLPSSYITSQAQKIDLYQRIYTVKNAEELLDLEGELKDRYGYPPEPVKKLFEVAFIRIMAHELGLEVVQQNKRTLVLQFGTNFKFAVQELWALLESLRGKATFTAGEKLALKLKIDEDMASYLPRLGVLLKQLAELPDVKK